MLGNLPTQNKAASEPGEIEKNPEAADIDDNKVTFPIIGIGASAGGLRAFETFFENLPDDLGMGFVLIQHLDPHHESELAEILQNHTTMPVEQVKDQEEIRPNAVYVIPPGQTLSIVNGALKLSEPEEPRGRRAPIDHFFRSLADNQGENAVCIILSGTGNDGSLGLKRIKEQGGVVLVQSPEDAEYGDMPRNAVTTKLVDFVAPVGELAKKLVDIFENAVRINFPDEAEDLVAEEAAILQGIFTKLYSETGVDFTHYKRSTVLRRLQRRMQVNQIEKLSAYQDFVESNTEENLALFKDLLISVTNFFRDEEAWQSLNEKVISTIFERKGRTGPIRVWVPGCATGEEAYSLAMLLLEEATRRRLRPEIQIFATDLDKDALFFARRGLYPGAISADVSQERLDRFFERKNDTYQIRSNVKEIVLFSPHNLLKDAPFAHLDLVSCRNLLIYLDRKMQRVIFQIFHYALDEDGFLFLGGSESAEQARELFEPIYKRKRIYRARPGKQMLPRMPISTPSNLTSSFLSPSKAALNSANHQKAPLSIGELHRDLMLQRYSPPSVLVDRDYQIRYKFGDVRQYLQHREGEPSLNLLDNISDQLRVELRTKLFATFRKEEPPTPKKVYIETEDGGKWVKVRVEAVPKSNQFSDDLALVIFEQIPEQEASDAGPRPETNDDPTVVERLEDELVDARHRLQTTVEEFETSNEELRTSNEELHSINEEMRSTTEELETSREELRSTNEELTSLNQELKHRVDDLNRANSDLENLIEETDIATLFLDRNLCLNRYTPKATELFNIIPADIGRPFSHISHKIDQIKLTELARDVLTEHKSIDEEVVSRDGGWFLLHMRPYQTINKQVDGVVITLVNVTEQVRAERMAETRAKQQATLAEIGMNALRGMPLDELLDVIVQRTAETLDVDYAKVLKLLPDGENLLLLSGVGWREGLVGNASVGAGLDSQAGYTLHSDEPIIVKDLRTEERFSGPELLIEHGVISGISVIIQGQDRPFGVFGAHTKSERQFTSQDTHFLQGMANVVGAAIERNRIEDIRESLLTQVRGLTETLEERVKKRTEQLKKRGEQLSAVASALVVAEQRERERISQIIHDDLQQILYAAQMRTAMLDAEVREMNNEGLIVQIEELDKLNDSALGIARSLTVELSPPVLEGEGLPEAFSWLAGHMESAYALQVAMSVEEDISFENKDLYELVFQIVRELLFNVVKHADVHNSRLIMRRQAAHCLIAVQDDGKGFDISRVGGENGSASSYGLQRIHERLELFNGSLQIESEPGLGTSVTISLPCSEAKKHENP